MNKLGVHALVWVGGWSEAESEKAIAATAELGYDIIEIPVLNPEAMDAAVTARQLETYGVRPTTSLGLRDDNDISSEDPDIVARGEATLSDAVHFARDIGATYLGGVLYSKLGKYAGPATAAGRRNSIEVIARIADKAKAAGIGLGLEPVNRYESNVINTGKDALAFIDETGSDNVTVHLDSYHMNIEDGDHAAAIEACGDRLGYFHVGESHRGYLGTGTIDFRTIFRSLASIGYDRPITFESFSSAVVDPHLSSTLAVWRNLWDDGADLARAAKTFMESEINAAAKVRGS